MVPSVSAQNTGWWAIKLSRQGLVVVPQLHEVRGIAPVLLRGASEFLQGFGLPRQSPDNVDHTGSTNYPLAGGSNTSYSSLLAIDPHPLPRVEAAGGVGDIHDCRNAIFPGNNRPVGEAPPHFGYQPWARANRGAHPASV